MRGVARFGGNPTYNFPSNSNLTPNHLHSLQLAVRVGSENDLFEIGGRIVLGSVAYTFLKESKISATLAYFQSKMYLCDSYPRRSHISDSASTISYDYYLYSHHHKLA